MHLPLILYILLLVCSLGALPVAAADDAQIEQAIAECRMGTLTVLAPPGAEVRVEQLRHEFWFGAAISSSIFSARANPEQAAKYKQVFLENFNAAVTENALKWHAMEIKQGEVDYTIVDAILAWTDEHELPLRGHNIFWGIPDMVQDWQKPLDDAQLREIVKKRALDIGTRYRGRFAEYDLNNEMIHGNYYEERLGSEITGQMAAWVRQGDPEAVLYLNDYDILTGNRLDDYVAHIRKLLDQGVPIGGIGAQGHLHGESFDRETLQKSLRTLAQFNLPIQITEFNMPGQRSRYMNDRRLKLTPEQEEARAREIVDYYRICFAEPAVCGVLMWGFWEGANWIPASSLYKRDWTPTPAAEAYRDLIYKQWWTNAEGKTDAAGQYQTRAYFGKHRVTVNGTDKTLELKRSAGTAQVEF
ncbi:MAG: endo-1,4-beta-xylanase [Pirellulaceae bacterium]